MQTVGTQGVRCSLEISVACACGWVLPPHPYRSCKACVSPSPRPADPVSCLVAGAAWPLRGCHAHSNVACSGHGSRVFLRQTGWPGHGASLALEGPAPSAPTSRGPPGLQSLPVLPCDWLQPCACPLARSPFAPLLTHRVRTPTPTPGPPLGPQAPPGLGSSSATTSCRSGVSSSF